MRLKNLLFTTLSFISIYGYSQAVWIQMDSIKGPGKANTASFVLEDDGYSVAGYDGFNKKRSMVSYDVSQDDWDSELSLGGASGDGLNRSSAVGFQAYGKGFVALGEGDGYMFSDVWMFDRYTDTWTQMANFGGGARTQAVVFEIDDIAYVGTGKADDFATLLADFWSYDYVTNTWTQVADFPGTPRVDAVGSKMGGKGYVGLGYDGTSFETDFYEYYPVDDSWAAKASFPGTPRINATSFAKFPQFFVTTGDDGFNYLNDTWEYNYFGDVWSQTTDFPAAPRSGCFSVVIEGRCFVGGGFGAGVFYDDFYEFVFLVSNEEEIELQASVFPNPSNGDFQLTFPGLTTQSNVKVFGALGNEIPLTQEINNGAIKISLATEFSEGIYNLVIFENNEPVISKKVVFKN